MAVPLRKLVRDQPAFDIRDLPRMAWGALIGAVKKLFSVGVIAFILVALALISVSFYYVDRPVAQWLHKFEKSTLTGVFNTITNLGSATVMLALTLLGTVVLFLVSRAMRDPERARMLLRGAGQSFFVF